MDRGPTGVERAAVELSCPGRSVDGPQRAARAPGHRLVELEDRRLDAGAHVDEKTPAPLARPGQGVDDVVDEHEVAGLRPVAEDRAALPGREVSGEDGHDTCLAVGILTRSVDVAQGERAELDVVQLPVGLEVVDHDHLADPVRRRRDMRKRLPRR